MEIRFGKPHDIDSWMQLVDRVKESFPGLETAQALRAHRETVLSFIERDEAICAVSDGAVVGALLFSKADSMLCFLAVDPQYRRQHIAEEMTALMLTRLAPGRDVTVTTYREGIPEGLPARKFYQRMGFVPGKLTVEFGTPVQEFVLKR